MKKRILSLLLTFCMVLSIAPAAIFAEGSTASADITGTGGVDDPYLIYTAEGLKAFRDAVNNNNHGGAHAKLMADIVLNDGTFDDDGNYTKGASGADAEKWEPIGWYGNDYCGTFDGNGYTIRGLYVKDAGYAGLFGSVHGGTVKNVTVTGYVEGTQHVGGIAGYIGYATVSDCTNAAMVKAKRDNSFIDVGGIVGYLFWEGNVRSCTNLGSVRAQIDSDQGEACVGGIAGYLYERATIADCYNAGSIAIRDSGTGEYEVSHLGGIAGSATQAAEPSYISNCYSVGSLTYRGSASAEIRGIIGYNWGLFITNCCWLEGTAESGIGGDPRQVTNTDAHTKAEFADGTVLNLLKGDRTDSPWEKCGYSEAAGMIVPLLSWQTGDTFPIYTAEDLKIFRDSVNAGNTDIKAKLMNNIDLEGNETNRWTPIGSKDKPYTGTFDGNGKKIKGLYVDERGNNRSAGLFGYIETANSGATVVQNLTVGGTVFAGNEVPEEPDDYYGAGILVGEITVLAGGGVEYGTVKNCHTSGKVSSPMKAGGLAGETQYTHFESCTADVEVTVTPSESRYWGAYSGGFVGLASQSEFKDCVAYGNVTSVYASTGGFAGLLYYETTVTHCAAYGNVESDDWNIGGFAGYAEKIITIKNSIAMGDVVSNYDEGTAKAGGFAGVASSEWGKAVTFEKCHANGKVTVAEGKVGYGMVGGISSIRYFKTTDCSYNSEKNPSLDATAEGAWEGIEGKNTAGVLFDICVNYKGGHDMENVSAVAATCTENGSTAGQRCKDCGHTEGITVITAPGHKYSDVWSMDETNHWHECTECEAKSDVGKHTDTNKDHKCDVCEKVLSECADTDKDHKCDICGKTLSEHTGGTATCTEKAICTVCNTEYGEINPQNHSNLKHLESKAATEEKEGNIEYWYCEECGKYFADKDGLREITNADTVTPKLEGGKKSPKTGKTDGMAPFALLILLGGAAAAVIAERKKRLIK